MGNVISITTPPCPSRYDEVKTAMRSYLSFPKGTPEFLEAAEQLVLYIEAAFEPAQSRAEERARLLLIRFTSDNPIVNERLIAAMLFFDRRRPGAADRMRVAEKRFNQATRLWAIPRHGSGVGEG